MRFEVGEMARVAVARNPEFQGALIQIMAVGPFQVGQVLVMPDGRKVGPIPVGLNVDYISDCNTSMNGKTIRACFNDWQLAKLDPPAEPVGLTRSKDRDHANTVD